MNLNTVTSDDVSRNAHDGAIWRNALADHRIRANDYVVAYCDISNHNSTRSNSHIIPYFRTATIVRITNRDLLIYPTVRTDLLCRNYRAKPMLNEKTFS